MNAIRNQLGDLKKEMFEQSAMNGLEGARQARRRIKEKKQKELLNIEMFKHNIANANLSPMIVAKLSDLVSPSNTDIPNSYMVKSKLSDKDDARIKNLLKQGYY